VADPLNIPRWVVGAGWSGQDAVTATAIALRQPNPDAPGGLFGLGTGGDGAAQAKAAYTRQQAEGWEAFPAYRDGSFRLFLPAATVALAALAPTVAVDKITGSVSAVTDASQATGRAAGWLINPRSWERITQVALGVMFVVGGGFFLAKRVGYDPVVRAFTKADDAIARQTGLAGLSSGVGGSTGGGGSTSAPASSPPATSVPKPPPPASHPVKPASAPPKPKSAPPAAPVTSPLNPDVQRTKGILGQMEAQLQGHAPFKGRAKRPPVKIPEWKSGKK
jgi:hypothetical protein